MIHKREKVQNSMEIVMLEQLVPQDHILRKIDRYIDFSFIKDLTYDLYWHTNGRPGVDPVVLFKMLFIGYLFGIRSERQLVKDIEVNLAYRWFLGYSITEKIPDASTISKNRTRKFKSNDIPQKIFDNIVKQAIAKGFVGGKVLYSDWTHIKANANKRKFEKVEVEVTPKEYLEQLDKDVNEDRIAHGKKPLKEKEHLPTKKEIKKSTTDPDSGYMMKDNKPEGFFYLDHRTVDSKNNIIVDVHVTPANVSDTDPILKRLDRVKETFNFPKKTKYVGLDSGYSTNAIFKGLVDRNLVPVVAYRRSPHKKGMFTKNKFIYDFDKDIYICPNNFSLIYKTTTREGYREYRCFEEICANCPLRDKCISEKNRYKIVRRHVWEDHKDDNKNFLKTEKGKSIYKRRKETVERSFADSKSLHGLRYARMRGNENVREQCLLTAAVQNMKKIATKLFSRFKEIFIVFLCYSEKYLCNFLLIFIHNYARKTLCFLTGGFQQTEETCYINICSKFLKSIPFLKIYIP